MKVRFALLCRGARGRRTTARKTELRIDNTKLCMIHGTRTTRTEICGEFTRRNAIKDGWKKDSGSRTPTVDVVICHESPMIYKGSCRLHYNDKDNKWARPNNRRRDVAIWMLACRRARMHVMQEMRTKATQIPPLCPCAQNSLFKHAGARACMACRRRKLRQRRCLPIHADAYAYMHACRIY